MTTRYEFRGVLRTESGLHIGSGSGDFSTDALVVRTGSQPFVPGSSLKGALRSAVERMVAGLQAAEPAQGDLRTCLLDADFGWKEMQCPTVNTEWQEAFRAAREGGLSEETIQTWLYKGSTAWPTTLCCTCRLFGSPFAASKVMVDDLLLQGETETEIRHGVGIDRDTGAARAQIKFDYETVPAQCAFTFGLVAEDLKDHDLGLLCAGLRQLEQAAIALGGNRSRGLGVCRLEMQSIHRQETNNATVWQARLLNRSAGGEAVADLRSGEQISAFLDDAITQLFKTLA